MYECSKIENITNEIIERVLHPDELKEAVIKSVEYLKDSDSPYAQFDSYTEMQEIIAETIDDFSRATISTILQPHFGEMEEQMDDELE